MTNPVAFALFDTALGACAVAWGAHGIVRVHLPEADAAQTRRRLLRGLGTAEERAPPPPIAAAIEGMVALLRGRAVDLGGLELDLRETPAFDRRVYAVARTIGPGSTLSYAEVARRLGDRALARQVGQALARNPFAIVVPCHRVLASNGQLGGFSARGGADTKRRLLLIEGARIGDQQGLFDDLPPPH